MISPAGPTLVDTTPEAKMRITSLVTVLALMSSPLIAGVNRWTPADLGQANSVGDLAADHSNSEVAYVHTRAGIYKTADGGRTWRAVNDGLPDPTSVFSLIVTDDALYVTIGNTVFGSWDGGEHWQRRGSLGSVFITVLAFDSRAKTLIAGTSGGVFYSTDSGATWVNPPTPSFPGSISALVVSSNAALLEVRAGQFAVHGSIRSTDGGKTWQKSPTNVDFLFADASSPAIYGMTGGLVSVTDDVGDTWTKIPQPQADLLIASMVPTDWGFYAATNRGVYRYERTTQKWSLAGHADAVHGLAIAGSATRRLFAAPSNGVITMTEGDDDWKSANDGLPTAAAEDVAISNSEPATAYAATSVGVFRTENAGQNWTPTTVAADGVAISPSSSQVVYGLSSTVLRTSDSGATWKSVTPSHATRLAIAQSDPSTVYAALADGIAKSVDGGDTWSSIMSGMTFDYYDWYYGFQATSLTVDPSHASTAYLGRYSGLYKTTDGGASWQNVAPQQILTGLVIDPMDSSTLYAGAWDRGVRKSVDQGLTWAPAGLVNKQIESVAVDGSHVYATTSDGHIYRSYDGGQRWDGFEEGLGNGRVSRIAVDPGGSLLYAATNAGLYQYQIGGQDLQSERMPDAPLQLPDDQQGFVLPVMGSAAGAGGTLFTTDMTLTNTREAAQEVLVSWLPQAGGAAASFRLTIPTGVTTVSEISARLGISGIGSLAFLPVDAGGNADANASIDASARIWAHLPGGVAPISQSISSVRGSTLSDHAQLVVSHLRQDAEFRTNAGIVNLSNETHQFTIQINGARASDQVTVAVPPFSLVQMALPDADYGDLSVVAIADTATRCLLYTSLIDRSTLEAQTFVGGEPKPLVPPPVPTYEVWIFGNVVDAASNACINGATIEVVGDPRPSSRDVNRCGQLFETNFRITGLQQGASVTLRVAAEGYTTRDFPMVIEGDLDDVMVVALMLQKR
jgi:photosystem II stability/assembly factor-like uncharacterized protein